MIGQIRANIQKEKEILGYLAEIDRIPASAEEKEFYENLKNSLISQLKILNSAIPSLLKDVPEFQAEEKKIPEKKRIVTIEGNISISAKDKKEYMKQTEMSEEFLKGLKKRLPGKKIARKVENYKEPDFYTKTSSSMFSKTSLSISGSEFFKPLASNLKKANMPFLISTYISMMLLGSLIAFVFGLILFPALIISEIIPPIYGVIGIFALPTVAFMIFYIYPSSEAGSNKTKINDELPFVVMHMSAIAGSGIEPSKVFEILATSAEYPAVRKEMMKIMNQVNFYGYNLVAALRSTAKTTSSDRFANVINGISTTISSGGDLKEYLNKIAEDTLLDYKLRRKRFTTMSETYADIYTGLLVAAPLMFMLILVLMNVIGGGLGGMDSGTLAAIGIGALIVINIGFIVFLQFSQPES
jgi:flagellar protein FlaJ